MMPPIPNRNLRATAWDLIQRIAQRRNSADQLSFLCYEPRGGTAARFPTCVPPRSFYSKTVDELLEMEGGSAEYLTAKLVGGLIADATIPQFFAAEHILLPGFTLPSCNPNEVWALCSTIKQADEYEVGLPLLDFRAEAQPMGSDTEARTLAALSAALKVIKAPSGALLNSGGSYHYYGLDPLAIAEWRSFMHRSLLLEPLVDVRYIAHRLESGRATLRIGSSPLKPQQPHVVCWIGG